MANPRLLPLSAVLSVFLCSTAVFAQQSAVQAAPTVRITSPIDASQLVTIRGSVHPLANAQNDRGAAPDNMTIDRLHLVLKRSPSQETALRELIQEQNTPGSPNYHKWLTPAQFGAEFGPSDQDIATVENWLSSQGFTVTGVEPGKQAIEISGSVAQLRSAFHTQIHKYMVNGEMHYANANAVQIPAALAPVVGGFVSLNNFHLKSYAQKLGEASYNPATGRAKPSWTIGSGSFDYQNYSFVLSPADYAVQYDLTPLYNAGINGSGQTIAIINDSNINIDLVNQFRTLFSLPANPPQVIIDGNDPGVDGTNNPDGPNYDSVEAYLDVEWAGAVAPDATVDLVIAADTSLESGLILAAEHAVYGDVAPVLSLSFGYCEAGLGSENVFLNDLWEQAAAQGQTVMVSAGDSGSAGCDDENTEEYAIDGQAVSGFASTPYDVAVGGTDFYYSSYSQGDSAINTQLGTYWNTTANNSTPTATLQKVIPEQPWNNSQYGLNLFSYYTDSGNTATTIVGGSGGASNAALCSTNAYSSTTGACTGTVSGYAKPSWQSGTGVPSDGVRDIPDVSLFAANGYNDSYYPICATDGDCQPVSSGGTVQISGVGGTSAASPAFAGIMALVNQKYGRQGQADTILYPLAQQFPAAFHDVVNGTNSVPCAYSSSSSSNSPDCIAVSNAISVPVYDSSGNEVGTQLEGQIGSGTTAEYNATKGYDLATGLGTVDAAVLVNDWGNVKLNSTTVTFNATPTAITHGQPVTLSGTVSGTGTPTGNVAIMTDSTEPVQQGQTTFTLSNGSYSGSLTTLPGGTYNIWASYGGDASNAASVSPKTQITVSPENSAIAFNVFTPSGYFNSSQSSSIDYGTQLNLSAQVAPSADESAVESCTVGTGTCPTYTTPTGTVTFSDTASGSGLPNTAVINAEGDAEFNAPFTVGSHSVTASYSGDSSYNKSTASAINFTVVKDTPTIELSASAFTTSSSGTTEGINGPNQPLVFSVVVLNTAQASAASASSSAVYPVPVAPPTGTITASGFPSGVATTATLVPMVDPASLGGTQAVAGVADFTIPAGTASGTYTVKFSYSGDSNYNSVAASSNTTYTIPVVNTNGDGSQTPSIAITSMTGSISPNSTLTITGTVTGTGSTAPSSSPSAGTGILVYSSGYYITEAYFSSSSGATSNFSITLNSQTLIQGSNLITLQYTGDNNYNPVAITVNSGNAINSPLSDFSLVPDTTIVPVSAGNTSGATDTINVTSTNGYSGNVNLTCTAAPGITCSIPSSETLSSGGSTTAPLVIIAPSTTPNGTYNVLITGTDSTGEYVHTLGISAVVSGSSAPSATFALASNPSTLTIDGGATTGNTSTITVAPLGGFTGTVALACSVTGPSGATSPATCSLSSASADITGTASLTSTLTVATTSTTTAGTYTVTVTGTSGSITVTTPVTVNVSMPSFSLSNSGTITISSPGATTGNTGTITVTPKNGFTGTVALSCSVTTSPSGATDPITCSLPSSVSITSGAATATLTISSTAATSSMNDQKNLFWPSAGGGAVLAVLVFFWIPKRRRNLLAMFVLLAVFVSIAGLGCGGGGGSGGSGSGGSGGGGSTSGGTTTGAYVVTVTATSGSISQTTTVNVTVN